MNETKDNHRPTSLFPLRRWRNNPLSWPFTLDDPNLSFHLRGRTTCDVSSVEEPSSVVVELLTTLPPTKNLRPPWPFKKKRSYHHPPSEQPAKASTTANPAQRIRFRVQYLYFFSSMMMNRCCLDVWAPFFLAISLKLLRYWFPFFFRLYDTAVFYNDFSNPLGTSWYWCVREKKDSYFFSKERNPPHTSACCFFILSTIGFVFDSKDK